MLVLSAALRLCGVNVVVLVLALLCDWGRSWLPFWVGGFITHHLNDWIRRRVLFADAAYHILPELLIHKSRDLFSACTLVLTVSIFVVVGRRFNRRVERRADGCVTPRASLMCPFCCPQCL